MTLNPAIVCFYSYRFTRFHRVRVFTFLLSGLFCCLGFSVAFFFLFGRGRVFFAVWAEGKSVYLFCCLVFFVVWAFRLCIFFAVWAGACFFFCRLGGGPSPAQTAKKITPEKPKQQKKQHAPAPSENVCFFAVWVGGRFFFCCLGGGRVLFFAVWAGGRVLFFAVWAGGRVLFFAVWAGGVFFFAVWAGDVFFCLLFGRGREFTHLPVCLARLQATQQQKRPNSKKKKTRVPVSPLSLIFTLIVLQGFEFKDGLPLKPDYGVFYHPSCSPVYVGKYVYEDLVLGAKRGYGSLATIPKWTPHIKQYTRNFQNPRLLYGVPTIKNTIYWGLYWAPYLWNPYHHLK